MKFEIDTSLGKGIRRVWCHLDRSRKFQLFFLLILMIMSALTEVFGIGALFPLLAFLVEPATVSEIPYLRDVLNRLGIEENEQIFIFLVSAFGIFVIFSGIFRLILLWANIKFSFLISLDLSKKAYANVLNQDYSLHINRNNSSVINIVANKTAAVVSSAILPVLVIISSLILLISIFLSLLAIDFAATSFAFALFAILYGGLYVNREVRFRSDGQTIARDSDRVIKVVSEGLGGIREIIIERKQAIFVEIFDQVVTNLRNAQARSQFLTQNPRLIIEPIGILMFLLFIFLWNESASSLSVILPTLGTLALGAQKMLPCLQQIYASITNMKVGGASVADVLDIVELPTNFNSDALLDKRLSRIDLQQGISLENLWFRYSDTRPYVLKNVNLTLHKGEKIGIVGVTGQGKSTLVDLILGLLDPSVGSVAVGGIELSKRNISSWHDCIAHVPQRIFIADDSVGANIAFGVPRWEADVDRIQTAAQLARIHDDILELEDGYRTRIGEDGSLLSGGQAQRIGIARALYSKKKVLILDEATSSLDPETEYQIIEGINETYPEISLIMVSHRAASLSNCDRIFRVSDGRVLAVDVSKFVSGSIPVKEPRK